MTINGLSKFLKDRVKKCDDKPYLEEVPITVFSGKKIAVDASLWIFKNFSVASREEIYSMKDFFEEVDGKMILSEVNHISILRRVSNSFLRFIRGWLDYNIVPIMVWDGKSRIEKKNTQIKRQEKQKKREKLDEALDFLKTCNLKEYESAIKNVRDKLAQMYYPTRDDTLYISNLAENLGVPNVIAPHDAEAFCASLFSMKKVCAVFSDDSDCYALGIDVMILEWKYQKDGIPYYLVSYPWIVRENLGLTTDQFRDFCIMCGTDFNNNIPGIAAGKSYPLIKKYGCIEEIEKNKEAQKITIDKDFGILQHEKNRKFFSPKIYNIDDDVFNFTPPSKKTLKRIFEQYELKNYKEFIEGIQNLNK
jgi:flap endonuclease-1